MIAFGKKIAQDLAYSVEDLIFQTLRDDLVIAFYAENRLEIVPLQQWTSFP